MLNILLFNKFIRLHDIRHRYESVTFGHHIRMRTIIVVKVCNDVVIY